MPRWIHCHCGYIACGYCGYIATVDTVGSLPLERQRSGTMVTCVCCSQPHLSAFLFMKKKNRMLTWHLELTSLTFFKKKKKSQCWHLLLLKKIKKNYSADIWSWRCWLRKKMESLTSEAFFWEETVSSLATQLVTDWAYWQGHQTSSALFCGCFSPRLIISVELWSQDASS